MQRQFLLTAIVLMLIMPACITSPATSTPIPVGSEAQVNGVKMTIADVSSPPDELLSAMNPFSDEPKSANNYILITVSATCTRQEGISCTLDAFQGFTLTDPSGAVKEQAAAFTEGVLDDGHFSGEAKAWLVFEATQNEAGLILSYEPPSGADKVYLAIQ